MWEAAGRVLAPWVLCHGTCGAPDPCLSWVLLTPAGKILGGARWSLQQGSLRATAQQGSRREH